MKRRSYANTRCKGERKKCEYGVGVGIGVWPQDLIVCSNPIWILDLGLVPDLDWILDLRLGNWTMA